MLTVLVRTGEGLAVAAATALAAAAAGCWWLRRRARQLMAVRVRHLLAGPGRPQWAGLIRDRPLSAVAWRRQVARAAWRLVRSRAPHFGPAAPRRRDRGSGVSAEG